MKTRAHKSLPPAQREGIGEQKSGSAARKASELLPQPLYRDESNSKTKKIDRARSRQVDPNVKQQREGKLPEQEDARKPSPSRKRPAGYVADSRVGKVQLSVHVAPDLRNAVHRAAGDAKMSVESYVSAVLWAAAEQQVCGLPPAKVVLEEALAKFEERERARIRAALRSVLAP